jgi:ribosomal protein S18 acetylase RimI-like enzyme
MIPLTIRPVGPGDLATLTKLAEDFHAEDDHVLDEGGRRALAAIADGEPLARAWLFELGGRAIGYGVLTLGFSVEYGGRDGFIDDLYLAPVARGRGLGRQAMAFLEAQARELGIKALHLEVGAENARALGLYRRSGFRDNGRRLMCKRLV